MNNNMSKYHNFSMELKKEANSKPTLNYAGVVLDRKILTDNKLDSIDKNKI